MKKRTKIIIGLAIACAGTLVLAACGGNNNPYPDRAKEGYTVSVKFDANGGQFSKPNVSFVYLYRLEEAQKGIKLSTPDMMGRGTVVKADYFLAGWYRERELRTDEAGRPLDELGAVCDTEQAVLDEDGNPVTENGEPVMQLVSENGLPQGYYYSDPWDFDRDVFTCEEATYSPGEYTLTLYAAWIPLYHYDFYAMGASGWEKYSTYSYNPQLLSEIGLPQWNDATGAMDYGYFPQKDGSTFLKAYKDGEKREEIDKLTAGSWDKEHALATEHTIPVYTDWREGLWFRIGTAQQFVDNLRSDGCYEILADLDFEGVIWPAAFATGSFGGTILGGGHTFSNITVEQRNSSTRNGGLFGNLLATARFEEVVFSDITYSLMAGSRIPDASFGLFAGVIAAGAQFRDVTVSGTLRIGSNDPSVNLYPQYQGERQNYSVGLFAGSGTPEGVQCEGIALETLEGYGATADESGNVTIEIVET